MSESFRTSRNARFQRAGERMPVVALDLLNQESCIPFRQALRRASPSSNRE